jgi:hypothetical protein
MTHRILQVRGLDGQVVFEHDLATGEAVELIETRDEGRRGRSVARRLEVWVREVAGRDGADLDPTAIVAGPVQEEEETWRAT